MFILGFPLLLIPFAIYNIIAFLMPGVSWTATLTTEHMVSGADWTMSAGDMLITLAILLLFGEMMKSTRIGIRTVVDHALSLVLFLGMLVEFLLVAQASTATFFLLLVISFVDVLGGFAVTLRSAQRDLTVEGIEHISS
jgi:membrane-anchored protein YejM (alkaline phosphatase superfamily)